jgi:hypothetical protein
MINTQKANKTLCIIYSTIIYYTMENITITKSEYDYLIKENIMLTNLLKLQEKEKQLLDEIKLLNRLKSLYPTTNKD